MRRGARAGFTLLEMVLAMTALALISAICYGAFHVGMRAVAAGTCAVTTAQRLRVASDVFTRQVRSVEPFPQIVGGFPEIYFIGRQDSLSFVTAAAQLGGGGLAQVTYRIEDDPEPPCGKLEGGKQRLVLEEVPFFSSYTVGTAGGDELLARSAVLLSGVEGLAFRYFDQDAADDPGCDGSGWCQTWDASPTRDDPRENLPIAVRLTIEHVPGIETGVWGQETPIVIASYYNEENRDPNAGLSLENDELAGDEFSDEDEADEADEIDEDD